MAEARRRRVFVGKVLQRLFPHVPRSQETPASENPPEGKKAAAEEGRRGCGPPTTGGPCEARPGRRLYTVSLPPGGCLPSPPPEPPSCSASVSENSSSSDDLGGPDPEDPPKRRRIRKPRSKKILPSPDDAHVEPAGFEKQQNLLQGGLQSRPTEGPTMSKNKKRKLKKKQQAKRRREAGVRARAPGVSFTYQPVAGSGEQDAAPDSEGPEGQVAEASPEDAGDRDARREDAGEEAGNGTGEKARDLLSFLRATQEIYFYDGGSGHPDLDLAAASDELLRSLQAGGVAPADVLSLHRMKTLLRLRDAGRLRPHLDEFAGRCALPPDHARVIAAFFNYWITHILPEENCE